MCCSSVSVHSLSVSFHVCLSVFVCISLSLTDWNKYFSAGGREQYIFVSPLKILAIKRKKEKKKKKKSRLFSCITT